MVTTRDSRLTRWPLAPCAPVNTRPAAPPHRPAEKRARLLCHEHKRRRCRRPKRVRLRKSQLHDMRPRSRPKGETPKGSSSSRASFDSKSSFGTEPRSPWAGQYRQGKSNYRTFRFYSRSTIFFSKRIHPSFRQMIRVDLV